MVKQCGRFKERKESAVFLYQQQQQVSLSGLVVFFFFLHKQVLIMS